MGPSGASDAMERFLEFAIGEEVYAVDLLRVREVVPYDRVTRVPTAPAFLKGVVDRGGVATPVVDLGIKFGLGARPASEDASIMIVHSAAPGMPALMGIVADDVRQVLELEPEAIEAAPSLGARIHVDFMRGLSRSDRGLAIILDLDRVLSATELQALQGFGADSTPGEDATTVEGALAPRLPASEGSGSASVRAPHLALRCAGHALGIRLSGVKEILGRTRITRVPGAAAPILGAINLRGSVVPVLDLAAVLGWSSATGVDQLANLILLETLHEGAPTLVAVATEAATEIMDLAAEDIREAPPFGLPMPPDLISGVGRSGDRFIPLADAGALLSKGVGTA
jgi:purine-binding chemotaxis protein CheW